MFVGCKTMSATTQCPTCNTRFKVNQEQLDAHQGLVRCGRCQAVFNATEFLQDDQPSPQLDLPMAQEEEELPVAVLASAPNISIQQAIIETEKPVSRAQKITFPDHSVELSSGPPDKNNAWAWTAGCLLLIIALLAQAAYFFRVEIAASQPGLKPVLVSYCQLFQCSVPLPQKADLMSIESSDLEADSAQSSVIALNALLRNHAPYVQAFPQLELTLTDAQDNPLARRTFRPGEYLKPDEDEKQGLAGNRELSVKLNLNTTDIKASGYRLFLFYPK